MSSIPAGDWHNPAPEAPWCSWRGCNEPRVEGWGMYWFVDGSVSIVLWACDYHTEAAEQSWLQGVSGHGTVGQLEGFAL